METASFNIREPWWKNRSIGIKDSRIAKFNEIQILYTDKSGQRPWPDKYEMTDEDLRSYPVEVHGGVKLRIVPIDKLKLKGWESL